MIFYDYLPCLFRVRERVNVKCEVNVSKVYKPAKRSLGSATALQEVARYRGFWLCRCHASSLFL